MPRRFVQHDLLFEWLTDCLSKIFRLPGTAINGLRLAFLKRPASLCLAYKSLHGGSGDLTSNRGPGLNRRRNKLGLSIAGRRYDLGVHLGL